MQEQIEMSGLEIMSSLSSSSSSSSSSFSSSSSSSSQLQWNSTNQWSPLLGGGREFQACVTIESGNENGSGGQTIVVIGGRMHRVGYTNSVIVWDPSTKRWRNRPSLNDRRQDLTKSMPLVDLVATTTMMAPHFQIQWKASKYLHYWKQWKHRWRQDKTTINGQGCNVACHLHEGTVLQSLFTIATLSFWVVTLASGNSCYQWILWTLHHPTTTTRTTAMENQY